MERFENVPLLLSHRSLFAISFDGYEAAAALGISRPTFYRLIRADGLPTIRVGGRVLIPVKQLREWLDEQVSIKGGDGNA